MVSDCDHLVPLLLGFWSGRNDVTGSRQRKCDPLRNPRQGWELPPRPQTAIHMVLPGPLRSQVPALLVCSLTRDLISPKRAFGGHWIQFTMGLPGKFCIFLKSAFTDLRYHKHEFHGFVILKNDKSFPTDSFHLVSLLPTKT